MSATDDHLLRTEKYRRLIPIIREVARRHGYAVAEHGSMQRDCDLIAVPWVDDVSLPADMVEDVRIAVDGVIISGLSGTMAPTVRPHNRLVWSIHLGAGLYIDFSVMSAASRNG